MFVHTKALLFSKKWHILAKIPVLGNLTHKLSNRLAPFHCSTLLSPTLRLNTLALVREGFKNQFHRICPLEEGTTPAPPMAIFRGNFPQKTSRKSQRKGDVPLVLLTIINQCYANLMIWSHLVSRQVWRPVESLGRHNHRCWDLVCFHFWCESFIHVILKKKNQFSNPSPSGPPCVGFAHRCGKDRRVPGQWHYLFQCC